MTLVIGSDDHSQGSASSAPAASAPRATSSAPSLGPSAVVTPEVDTIMGSWAGRAKDSNGVEFTVTLKIEAGCALGKLCGSIGVSHVPCHGQVFLETIDNDEFEFRVDNFDKRSDSAKCQPGAGERFKLQADGTLAYRTTYEPIARGVLHKD